MDRRGDRQTKLCRWLVVVIAAALVLSAFFPASWASKESEAPQLVKMVPDALIGPGSGAGRYVLVVEKSTQKLYFYEHREGQYFLLRTLLCSTGEIPGDKSKEGDKKTPEGFYVFIKKSIKAELADLYGVLAYPMDYPNFYDHRLGKRGDGIWMHGINKVLKPLDSNGCIELQNYDIMNLEEYIHLYETPIIVYEDVVYKSVEEIGREADRIQAFVESWRRAWETKDFKAYMASYAQDFISDDGKDHRAWEAHKLRLNQKYAHIRVELDGIRIFRHQGVIAVLFAQHYRGDGFKSDGDKRLYLREKPGGGYEIVAEEWSEFPPQQPVKMLSAEVKREVIEAHRLAGLQAAVAAKIQTPPRPEVQVATAAEVAPPPESESGLGSREEPVAAPARPEPKVGPSAGPQAASPARPESQVAAPAKPAPQAGLPAEPQAAPPEKEVKTTGAPAAPTSPALTEAERIAGLESSNVRLTVENWLDAWRKMDLDRYLTHYHPDFRYKNMDLEGYRDYKASLAAKYKNISIGVKKMKITVEGGQAKVTFIQDYQSDKYQDHGLKTLVLQKQGSQWQIRQELWQDLSGAGDRP
ncbi:MAG: L,D-transpeptidase family protein [Thermodesulfobacteriota bacterium]